MNPEDFNRMFGEATAAISPEYFLLPIDGSEDAEIIEIANRFAEAGAEPFLTELDGARKFAVPMLYKVTDIFIDQFTTAVAGHDLTY